MKQLRESQTQGLLQFMALRRIEQPTTTALPQRAASHTRALQVQLGMTTAVIHLWTCRWNVWTNHADTVSHTKFEEGGQRGVLGKTAEEETIASAYGNGCADVGLSSQGRCPRVRLAKTVPVKPVDR